MREPSLPLNTTIDVYDVFDAKNEFHGGALGVFAAMDRGPLTFEMLAKLGFGNMRQTVTIDGSTVVSPPGGPVVTNVGGLLAQQTNIGQYQQDRFILVPEAGITLSYQCTQALELSVGYAMMYWSEAVMAGDQVDTSVNLTQLGGPLVGEARPAFAFRENGFWIQGLTLGLNWRY